jgi:hypothetical protein
MMRFLFCFLAHLAVVIVPVQPAGPVPMVAPVAAFPGPGTVHTFPAPGTVQIVPAPGSARTGVPTTGHATAPGAVNGAVKVAMPPQDPFPIISSGDRAGKDLYVNALMNRRVYWGEPPSGCSAWWRDWRFFVTNQHPLLAILCSHRHHPISKCERMMITMSEVGLSVIISGIVEGWDILSEHPRDSAPRIFANASVVGVILSFLSAVLVFIATMDDRCCRRHRCCKCLVNCCGKLFLVGTTVAITIGAAILLGVIGASDDDDSRTTVLKGFSTSLMQSWFGWWFLTNTILFTLHWLSQKGKYKRRSKDENTRLHFKELRRL